MSKASSEFWSGDGEYQELAERYERNIERVHPGSVTSQGMCPCLEYVSYCTFAATAVDYYEYRGESI